MMGRLSNTIHRQHSHSNMPAASRTIYYTAVNSSSKTKNLLASILIRSPTQYLQRVQYEVLHVYMRICPIARQFDRFYNKTASYMVIYCYCKA
jgi:hypothetical protein